MAVSPLHDPSGSRPSWARGSFLTLFDAAPDAIVMVDVDGVITLLNPQAERLFGYTEAELVGEKIEKLVPPEFRAEHSEHRARYFYRYADPRPMGSGLEFSAVRKDGTSFPVDISLSPLETQHGRFMISSIRDITQRKRAEDQFRSVIESAPDALVIVDANGNIAIVNTEAEKLFGCRRDEIIGRPVEILVPGRYREFHSEHRHSYLKDASVRPMGTGLELNGIRKDGTEFPVDISLSPLATEKGNFVISAVRDISQRKQAETAITKLNEELYEAVARSEKLAAAGQMMAVVAQDINDPLESLTGALYLLEKNASLDEGGKELVIAAQAAVARIAEICRQTLAPHHETPSLTSHRRSSSHNPVPDR